MISCFRASFSFRKNVSGIHTLVGSVNVRYLRRPARKMRRNHIVCRWHKANWPSACLVSKQTLHCEWKNLNAASQRQVFYVAIFHRGVSPMFSTVPFVMLLLKRQIFSCSEHVFLSKREKSLEIQQFDWFRIFFLSLWKQLY